MSIKAVITFDDSWDEEGVRNAFEDNDQYAGIVSVEIRSGGCGNCDSKDKPIMPCPECGSVAVITTEQSFQCTNVDCQRDGHLPL